jgi:signal transduction histidine kinase
MLTQGQWEKHDVEIVWERLDDLPRLVMDRDRIRQMFLNLVLNAIEATPQHGQLEIATESTQDPAGIRFTFVDTGRGIPSESLPHVFEPFFTTKPDGIGLGLYVTQQIVKGHGGRISVDSQQGAGTTITVWLPASQDESRTRRNRYGRGSAVL